jgi:N-acetylmuramoyl-L-alanine amidase CwlA
MGYTIKENLTVTNFTPRGTAPEWIVIHNTYNHTTAEGTAYANTQYFKTQYRGASASYFVDDGDVVWRCVRDTDTAWHCGDAPSRNGCYNWNSIGIEVCEGPDGSFSDKEIAVLSWLVPMLMEKYGIDARHVCRHYDVTNKQCPYAYTSIRKWQQLKDRITGGDDMPSVEEIWQHKINGVSAQDRLYLDNKQLFDRTDYSGRGKDGATPIERICWIAKKQEDQQKQLDRLEKKIDELIKAVG